MEGKRHDKASNNNPFQGGVIFPDVKWMNNTVCF